MWVLVNVHHIQNNVHVQAIRLASTHIYEKKPHTEDQLNANT